MAWSTPMTAVANTGLTAAQWNASVRDNLLETAAAKATTSGRIFVATGTNALAERTITTSTVLTGETTTSTAYTALATAGPSLTATTGVLALVYVVSQVNNTTDGASARHSYSVSGATTTTEDDDWSALIQATSSRDCTEGRMSLPTLTAGSNTFTSLYRVSSGTGRWQDRTMIVMAL